MKFTRIVPFTLFLLLALIVAGCAAPAEDAAGEPPAEDEITITWWSELAGIPANIDEVFIEPFEAANPGIKLEIIGQEALNDTLRTAIQAGEAPDILQTPGASFIAEYVDAGSVLALDDFSADLGCRTSYSTGPISQDSWAAVCTASH